ncbi:3'-5' exonuclease [Clostridium beijerinckii]|uniref:Exonuclease domain-containing protein n=1 Tax=Clostridium beijerinckii TaxID=1520 RepID=A0AAW3WAU8_CLOBE|nr:3'-5' exonuclease [Clostridium beijerinckii]MBC2458489.1 exonuclease domain-containing protein [Clostridium beijerinckii]MBC2475911.1 exonuclease domain-containing protein [Clostridium beijerinckii]NOV61582.1 inhibitor of KinA sporulation pathway (predicted exonuclease) [Clostridium beijerinckii]NOV68922.1 inhibitor of KinA sporulation pathway (predicted exonuclease) [Clostridium beijerinckii]NOW34964.1 inhibitor of KinA sporulation pathway (predicted exonuclease) [Clostridium beijerinckii]
MYYVIYDLEFNQKSNASEDCNNINFSKFNADTNIPLIPFEIIQIGAIKLDNNFQKVSTFNSLVKPTLYKTIHPYVENLTKITCDKVSSCKNFINVHEAFLEFIGDDDVLLCVWGVGDIKELYRNLGFYNLSTSYISKYIDIQKYASKYLKAPKNSRIGLRNAVEILNIPIYGEFHDALNDAYYTSEIFKRICNKYMKPETYVPSPAKRTTEPKEVIDTEALLKQFEKMYNRELTKDEKSMIKIAYMMGKTKQFLK